MVSDFDCNLDETDGVCDYVVGPMAHLEKFWMKGGVMRCVAIIFFKGREVL